MSSANPAAVARFRDVFDHLRGLAVYGDAARALITGLMSS